MLLKAPQNCKIISLHSRMKDVNGYMKICEHNSYSSESGCIQALTKKISEIYSMGGFSFLICISGITVVILWLPRNCNEVTVFKQVPETQYVSNKPLSLTTAE